MGSRLSESKGDPQIETRSDTGAHSRNGAETASNKLTPHTRRLVIPLAIIFIIGATLYVLMNIGGKLIKPESVQCSGQIEGEQTNLSVRMPAKVKAVFVKEGDRVHKGQLLVLLDDRDLVAKEQEARAAVTMAQDKENAARMKLGMLKEGQQKIDQKTKGFFGHIAGALGGAKKKKQQISDEITATQPKIQLASDGVREARAAVAEVAANASYFRITSPIDGVCETRGADPGELVAPGQIVITIIDMNSLYLKGFIPEENIGKVKIGQKAKVYLDSFPKNPLDARLTFIDSQAAFTPENVYFKSDRVKQVFAVKLAIDKPGGLAKPGMPADAEIVLPKDGR